MTEEQQGSSISEAIAKIRSYVTEITGTAPSDAEISKAISGYFVLKEISDYITMYREQEDVD